jgi:hypothetical protein
MNAKYYVLPIYKMELPQHDYALPKKTDPELAAE